MSVRFSNRAVAEKVNQAFCPVPIREQASQTIKVNIVNCSYQKIDVTIVQGADKSFIFQDQLTADYSNATEITVDVWENNINGSSIYSASLTGSDITLISDSSFTMTIDSSESELFPRGNHYIEIWVTLPGTVKRAVGIGRFRVVDSRKQD